MSKISVFIVMASVFLVGCVQSGHKQFYTEYMDVNKLNTVVELIPLEKGEKIKVFTTTDLKRDSNDLSAKYWAMLGQSSFSGVFEDNDKVIAQAKRVGATLVLVSSSYQGSQTINSNLYLPDNQVTTHTGNVSAYNAYGGNAGSATYSGTSTTYGTKVVPVTNTYHLYEQHAGFFVKVKRTCKYCYADRELSGSERAALSRNTGVYFTVVREDGYLFNSNILTGDILIELDGKTVRNPKHFMELIDSIDPKADRTIFTIIRNGETKKVTVTIEPKE